MSMIINIETVSGLENIDLETINIEEFCKLLSRMIKMTIRKVR